METTSPRIGRIVRVAGLALVLIGFCRTPFAVARARPRPQPAARVQATPRVVRNVHYGSDIRQRFDVYAPADAKDAPVIFMVHGGGWAHGDKSARGVTENKVARWVPRGFVVISTNYRMLPQADPIEQAKDVARAIAVAQQRAASWGGDPARFIVMGHSAGGHLVTLLATSPALTADLPLTPLLGVVSIESGALDVVEIMRGSHPRLYDRAFGADSVYWREVSPIAALSRATVPILLVCSIRRPESCNRSDRFAARATALGGRAAVLREDLSHADADARLGVDPGYTRAVETFMRGLDASVDRRLAPPDSTMPDR